MAVANSPRKFTSGHFAFMRAVVQEIDLRASWDRYLRIEGEHEDLRRVRSTIARMRTEFAAAAGRHARPGTARLILVEADKIEEVPRLPSLAAFAAERGLEDFSETEQQAAFVEAYGPGTDAERKSRRARLIRRQLEALEWLERLVAQDPSPDDRGRGRGARSTRAALPWRHAARMGRVRPHPFRARSVCLRGRERAIADTGRRRADGVVSRQGAVDSQPSHAYGLLSWTARNNADGAIDVRVSGLRSFPRGGVTLRGPWGKKARVAIDGRIVNVPADAVFLTHLPIHVRVEPGQVLPASAIARQSASPRRICPTSRPLPILFRHGRSLRPEGSNQRS